jgi:hypothetical protein
MDRFGTKVSSKTIESISEAVFPKGDFDRQIVVELQIVCDPPFNIRELNSYLRMTDRVFGRMLDWNLYSYSQRPSEQLTINRISSGSNIFGIIQELDGYVTPLVILWIVLKYLPIAVKTTSESVKNFSESYKTIQEARLKIPAEVKKLESESLMNTRVAAIAPYEARKLDREALKFDEERMSLMVNRKKLEFELNQEELLQNLDPKHIKQIPQLIKDLLSKEKNEIVKARRFAIKNVKEVKIRKKRRNE